MSPKSESKFAALRDAMVEQQLVPRGIRSPDVLAAMGKVPRHVFVPEHLQESAYQDTALPIGPDQSISQPFIVAEMVQDLKLRRSDRVLEIGTGSGFQTAVLAEIAAEVYSMEIDGELLARACALLDHLGYQNIHTLCRDGFLGWKEEAPFDKVIVSAAPQHIPRELVRQLRVGGRMVVPLGSDVQVLIALEKTRDGLDSSDLGLVRFVEMKGEEPK